MGDKGGWNRSSRSGAGDSEIVLRKASPKSASKLGAVMFAVIPLAKTAKFDGSMVGAVPGHGHAERSRNKSMEQCSIGAEGKPEVASWSQITGLRSE